MKKFYLTTPLYYVNDVPHIGHAYTTIAADVLARWKRLNGEDVHFLTGTDEHGAKIAKAAEVSGESPATFVERIAQDYHQLWKNLLISFDDFIRTDQDRHKVVVQRIFEKLKTTGDIYKGHYEGWYCLSDETYYSDSELINNSCPSCGRAVQKLKEESYFFKLSKYQQPLLDYYFSHPHFLSPPHRANEILNFVKSGLKDLSVSRTRVKWGIPVPSDPGHVVYVWFDALINYIAAVGYLPPSGEKSLPFDQYWPANIHLVGKEIFRFHVVIWPAILMALNLPLPDKVYAHGWWTVEGAKMSKSLGNVVDPQKIVDEFGVDAFRYFLLREVPFGGDGDFSLKALFNRYNTELANNLGNLVQRTITLLCKNFDGIIPMAKQDSKLLSDGADIMKKIDHAYEEVALGSVLEIVYELMIRTNKYIDDQAPWKLDPSQKVKLAHILIECLCVLKILVFFLWPFMPLKMTELWKRLGENSLLEKEAPGCLHLFRQGKTLHFEKGQKALLRDPLFMRKGGKKS